MSRHGTLYRRLLIGYPAAFRRDYAEEMAGLFDDLLADAKRSGQRFPALRLWVATFIDFLVSASYERKEDAVSNHPISTRVFLIGIPAASLSGMALFGSFIGIPVMAVGLILLVLGWRAVSVSIYGPGLKPWWFTPLLGIALFGVGIAFALLPGPTDLMWILATLVGTIGMVTTIVSVALSLFSWVRGRPAPSASG